MLGPNQIGPERPITGRGPVIGAIPKEWAGHVAHFYSLGIISKIVPISETASFSQNENVSFSENDIRLFFQNKVISKNYF